MSKFKLRSIDVWDTLLRRTCHPEAIKLQLARHASLRLRERLYKPAGSHWVLYRERLAVEQEIGLRSAESGFDDEYDLIHVLRRWLFRIADLKSDDEVQKLAHEFSEFELACEEECSYVDPGILSFLTGYPAEKTIYLSDFYMPSEMLDRLLHSKGLRPLVRNGFVSCDIRKSKRSGRLFGHVHQSLDVAPEQHVHIGDSAYSDVEIPGALGIAAVHFVPEWAAEARRIQHIAFGSREALFEQIAIRAEEAARELTAAEPAERSAAFRAGVRAAPLFLGFCLFVAERAIRDKVDSLFFLSQEGDFLHRVFAALFPKRTLAGLPLPDSRALGVSRVSTFLPSFPEPIGHKHLKLVWSLHWQQRVSTLFRVCGLEAGEFGDLLANLGLKEDELIIHPESDPRILRLIEAPPFREATSRQYGKRRERLDRYLDQQGLGRRGKIAFVDVGWRGTIQDNLARMRPDVEFTGYYLGLRKFLNPQPPNVEKHAYGIDERRGNAFALLDSFEPLEVICSSMSGSTEDYREEGDVMVPVKSIHPKATLYDFPRDFQDGVVFATREWRPSLANYAVSSDELRELSVRLWTHISQSPPAGLVRTFLEVPQHDVFGFGGHFDRGRVPSVMEMLFGLFNRRYRNHVILYLRRTQWEPSIVQHPGMSRPHRMMASTLFRLARLYKRGRVASERTRLRRGR
ncbi:HAD family hydrolase [Bradyrhizobium sp. CCGB12]|uniref:HAD family hydrolase n=1 Tax=Bradyrhizobium sp. CCGB12 TaxID=2949632 RepID=UPI0020B3A314|nr:HAD family hydrolase [Bradyrhizobium sp. CCGB12]MCP3392314.1 HAD family hydrolase [Bradyrhizobium sp. CCGB12]